METMSKLVIFDKVCDKNHVLAISVVLHLAPFLSHASRIDEPKRVKVHKKRVERMKNEICLTEHSTSSNRYGRNVTAVSNGRVFFFILFASRSEFSDEAQMLNLQVKFRVNVLDDFVSNV